MPFIYLAWPSPARARAWGPLYFFAPWRGARGARARARHFLKSGSRLLGAPQLALLAEVGVVDRGVRARGLVGAEFFIFSGFCCARWSQAAGSRSRSRVLSSALYQRAPHRPSFAACRLVARFVGVVRFCYTRWVLRALVCRGRTRARCFIPQRRGCSQLWHATPRLFALSFVLVSPQRVVNLLHKERNHPVYLGS